MHPKAILREIRQLYNVSDRLDLLAEQHPLVSDALISISGRVRNTATLLRGGGRDENAAALRLRSSKCLSSEVTCEVGETTATLSRRCRAQAERHGSNLHSLHNSQISLTRSVVCERLMPRLGHSS
jgi:hypothetical protein